jgi:integrase
MRTGELLALRWEDFDGESFMVERSRTRGEITTTKTDQTRRVLLTDKVTRIVAKLPSRFKQGYVFLAQHDKPYQSGYHLNQVFATAHKQTNTRRSQSPNYPWRHTYASIGLISGLPPAFLAKQLGHTLSVFETTYAKWIDRSEDRELLNVRML